MKLLSEKHISKRDGISHATCKVTTTRDYGLKHLIVQKTSKTDLLIDLSRIRPPRRLGASSNQK
jgi:hypothetical protein